MQTYLEIERARFEDRLVVRVELADQLRDIRVPSLILQPIVENAVRHGIAPRRAGGELVISASIETQSDGGVRLYLRVKDTGAGFDTDAPAPGRRTGVGLNNVERRLACCYGDAASLSITSAPGHGTLAELRMPVEQLASVEQKAG